MPSVVFRAGDSRSALGQRASRGAEHDVGHAVVKVEFQATALDACQHGFVPIVGRDACGDRDAAVHESNLFDLYAKYADVVSEHEVFAYLTTLTA